jgi:hypothetical protein
VNDIEDWLRDHDASLEGIARETKVSEHLVHLAAMLVLEGLPDEAVYEILGEHIISMDGQHDPLAGAPLALGRIRMLAFS